MSIPTRKLPGSYTQDGKYRTNRRAAKLIRSCPDARIVKYRDLPREAQLALLQYMAIDGEAWDYTPELEAAINRFKRNGPRGFVPLNRVATRNWERTLASVLPYYVEKYGGMDFGYIPNLPIKTVIEAVMNDTPDMRPDWKAYHEWYMSKGTKHQASGDKPWPVIIGSFDDETLEDGWNRFHLYAERKRETMPALWFPHQQSRQGAAHYRKAGG